MSPRGRDPEVIRLNRAVEAMLGGPSRLEDVPGASHLFGEPGALERVTGLAREWFVTYLQAPTSSTARAR